MSQLDAILEQFVAQGDDTRDKLLGASFVVSKKGGQSALCYQLCKCVQSCAY